MLGFPRVTFPIAVAAILRHFTKEVAFGAVKRLTYVKQTEALP